MNAFTIGTSMFWYEKLPLFLRKKIREKRIKKALAYAVKHSEFYRKYYGSDALKKDFSSLPPVTKQMLSEHFEEFLTDKRVTNKSINKFIEDKSNVTKKLFGEYTVTKTSGSTGKETTVLTDKNYKNVFAASETLRLKVRALPACGIFSDSFCLGRSTAEKSGTNGTYDVLNSRAPIKEIVEELNKRDYKTVISYPGILSMIALEKEKGNLKIDPVEIFSTGELLTDIVRDYCEKVFGCKVISEYMSTETGFIGRECEYGHMHYYDDWIDLEPINSDGSITKDGELSEKTIVTHMGNRIQPIIRYEISDMIRITRDHKCPCGSRMPIIEVIGRCADVFTFHRGDETVFVPMRLWNKYLYNLVVCQLVLHNEDRLEIRCISDDPEERKVIEKRISEGTEEILQQYGISGVTVYMSDVLPTLDPKSSKLKRITQIKD